MLLPDASLFATISEAQASHGILHGDYARYHRYCTHRLDRIRHHRDARTQLVHNPKYVSSTEAARRSTTTTSTTKDVPHTHHDGGGTHNTTASTSKPPHHTTAKQRRHAYQARLPPPVDASAHGSQELTAWQSLYLQSLLYQAERCWAQACAMQQQQQQGGNTTHISFSRQTSVGAPPHYNHSHCLRRLHKAAHWSSRLLDWIQEYHAAHGTHATLLAECQSYKDWMQANATLEQRRYAAALEHYQQSRTRLEPLVQEATAAEDPTALVRADVWRTRMEHTLTPLVRYCQYQAKGPNEVHQDTAMVEAVVDPQETVKGQADMVVAFGGRDIAVDAYQQVVVLYCKLERGLQTLLGAEPVGQDGPEGDDEYLQFSCDLDEMLDQIKKEQTYYASLPTGPAVAARREDLAMLLAYFQFVKLHVWRLQQERRISRLTDDAELVHAYDILQQNVQSMLELLHSAVASTEQQQEDDPLWLETQAHVLRIRAFRCYHLARLYEGALDGTPQQCLALLGQANKLLKRAYEEIAACDDTMKNANVYLESLDCLRQQINVMTCRIEATQLLERESIPYGRKTNRPLWLRLDDLDAGTVLVDQPPLPIVMPCKPVFFDIAYQLSAAGDFPIEAIQDFISTQEPKKGGVLGWFRSSAQ